MLHWFGSSNAAPPAPTTEAYLTLSPTTGRAWPEYGSMIVTRSSAASVVGFQTLISGLPSPARSYSTLTSWMPPWL